MGFLRLGLLVFVAVSFMITPSYAAIDSENIVGMWLFNEGSGDTAEDSSGNGNDGNILGGFQWVDGKFGKGIELNGTDGWVEVPHSNTVGFAKGTSFTIIVNFKGTTVGGSLVGKNYEDTTQAKPWYLLWNGGGNNIVSIYLRTNGDQNSRVDSTQDIGDDNWHFVAGRADASGKKVSIWIDGEMQGEAPMSVDDGYGTSEGVLHFGRHFDRYANGIIDDIALFNVALDEKDMNEIMDNGLEEASAVEASNKLATTWGKIKYKNQ